MKIYKFCWTLLFLFSSLSLWSQGWVKIYTPAAWGVDIYRDIDNSFIILAQEGRILKFSNEGEFVWETNLGKTNSLFYTSTYEFLLPQTNNSVDPEKASVTLLDSSREIKWEYQLNYPHPDNTSDQRTDAMAAIQTADGNYWVLGDIEEFVDLGPSESYFNYQPFAVELSSDGQELSFHTYCRTLPPFGSYKQNSISIQESGDGGFVLLTLIEGGGIEGNFPGFTKINAEGEMEWKQYFSNNLIEIEYEGLEYVIWTFAKNMVITESGEIVTAGMSTPKNIYFGAPYLMILNTDGSLQSFLPLQIPFNQEEFFLNIEITDIQAYGENFVLLYHGLVEDTYSMGFVIVDREGNILQNTFYENMNISMTSIDSRKIMVLEEGGFAIIAGSIDLTLIKTDSLGNCYPDTQFSAEDTGLGLYQFDNQSEYADSYLWEFGDGKTDTTSTLSHQYQAIGTYEVCLTATNLCDSFKKCESIEVSEVTDIEAYEWEQGLLVYPNPVHNTQLFVEIPQSKDIPHLTLYNNSGQQMRNQKSNSLAVSELASGVYYLHIQVGEEKAVRKIVVY